MKAQRFTVVLATDGEVTESELDGALDALGYHGVMVVAAETRDSHEHPCPSKGCIDKLRKDGHGVADDVVCCICWATGSEEATKSDDRGIVGLGDRGHAEHGGVVDDYPIVGYVEAGQEKVEHPC